MGVPVVPVAELLTKAICTIWVAAVAYNEYNSGRNATSNSGRRSSDGKKSRRNGASSNRPRKPSPNRNRSPAQRRTRRRSVQEPDPSSETEDNVISKSQNIVVYHFVKRLVRFVRLGGISQSVTEQKDFPSKILRHEIFLRGKSEFQDGSCPDFGYHRAHVVRAGTNPEIYNMDCFKIIRNFVGHTHSVPIYANEWHGPGGKVDLVQEAHLNDICSINFKELENQDVMHPKTFEELKEKILLPLKWFKDKYIDIFIKIIEENKTFKNYNDEQIKIFQQVVDEVNKISLETLLKKVKQGYNYIPYKSGDMSKEDYFKEKNDYDSDSSVDSDRF